MTHERVVDLPAQDADKAALASRQRGLDSSEQTITGSSSNLNSLFSKMPMSVSQPTGHEWAAQSSQKLGARP